MGRGRWGWWPTFDAESRNTNIPNSHGGWVGGGGVGGQLLMLSPELLKSQIPIDWGGGGGWGGWDMECMEFGAAT